jgi:hypothetical protein
MKIWLLITMIDLENTFRPMGILVRSIRDNGMIKPTPVWSKTPQKIFYVPSSSQWTRLLSRRWVDSMCMLFCLLHLFLIVRYVILVSEPYGVSHFLEYCLLPCYMLRHVTNHLRGAHLLTFPVNNIIRKNNTGIFPPILKCIVYSNCTKRGWLVL